MKILKNKKIFLIIIMIIIASIIAGIVVGATRGTIYQFTLPRGERDEAWGHYATELINGWSFDESRAFTVRSVDGYENQTVYCIEPGVGQTEDVSLSEKGEDYWNNYPSLNNSISPDEVKLYIGRIFQYGYTGNNNLNWDKNNETHQNEISHLIATQILIWETVVRRKR